MNINMRTYNNIKGRAKLIRTFKENFSELFELHNDDDLEVLWLYMNHPKEFDIIDNDTHKTIPISLFNKLVEKYPEEFV